jgi:tetratricopeptide (TPR) repeat protein
MVICTPRLIGLLRSMAMLVAAMLVASTSTGPRTAAAVRDDNSAIKWREDLRYLAQEMPKVHPNLFHRMTREQFETAVKSLDQRIPTLTRNKIIIELMRLVAMVGDGHTSLSPFLDPKLSFRSYPLRLYIYEDGLFVQSAAPEYAAVVGAQVLRIGSATADQSLEAVGGVIAHDNQMGVKSFAPYFLVIPEVLEALGIVDDMEHCQFQVRKGAEITTVTVRPIPQVISPFGTGGHGPHINSDTSGWIDSREAGPAPLWLRHSNRPFWFEYLQESRTVYVQYNQVADAPDETVAAFSKRVFAFVAENPMDRFVLDVRLNLGGNGYLNKPLILGLIKSDKINRPGKLFTIIGRRTFSAAQNLINELEKYTNTLFVGEPTAQNVNFYGDHEPVVLPNSGLSVMVSTLWWQYMDPRDKRQWTSPHISTRLTFEDYRSNVDTAMNAVLSYKSIREALAPALESKDLTLLIKLYRAFKNGPSTGLLDTERDMNALGYELLNGHAIAFAIQVFKLNVESYPQSWNAYDSLGEAYLRSGDKDLALENYQKSLELNPANSGAAKVLEKLRNK